MIQSVCLLIFVTLLLSSCMEGLTQVSDPHASGSTTQYATGLTDTERVRLALDRKKELRNIRKWDYLALKNNPEDAIAYYTIALENLPNDIVIRRKIAHAYYQTRNWRDAYLNYARVPITELKETELKELFASLFLDDARPDRLTELSKYTLDVGVRDYYQIIDTCYSGIHNCIVSIDAYTGSSDRIRTLQSTTKQSVSISPDFQYRNFLVAAELYKQWSYRATYIMTREILDKRPNYTEVRKLSWFALYELGQYSQARDILLPYLESNSTDLQSIIKLAEISTALGDYTTSSLYLNNAITWGYPRKTELERRLAYNYASLGDHASMLKVLSYLLQESDVSEDDYAVALSLALDEWENIRAYSWAYTAIAKYPNSPIIIPLYLRALRLNSRFKEIHDYIGNLSDQLASHPLASWSLRLPI